MKTIQRVVGFAVLLTSLLTTSTLLQAHHSLAAVYDIRKEGEITGVLTKVAFTNPHGAFHVAVTNEDGSETEWILTTGSANTLANLGLVMAAAMTSKPVIRSVQSIFRPAMANHWALYVPFNYQVTARSNSHLNNLIPYKGNSSWLISLERPVYPLYLQRHFLPDYL